MMAGDFESACPKIEEVYRLTEGAGALFTLAECYAKWDKPATARRHYRGYLKAYAKLPAETRKRQDERAKLATTQIAALSALIPTFTIIVGAADQAGLSVTVDGEPIPIDALNTPLPLEIGTHRVVATHADGRTAEREVNLPEGAQRRWEVTWPIAPAPPDDEETPPVASSWTPMEIAGVVIGVTGVAALGVGAVTGIMALGKRSTADDHCRETVCDQTGLDAVDSGKVLGDVSTITLAVGGAAAVAGLILFLVGGEDTAEGARLSPGGFRIAF